MRHIQKYLSGRERGNLERGGFGEGKMGGGGGERRRDHGIG